MADKKFLLEHNLTAAYERFVELCNESTLMTGMVAEEGEDDDPNQQGQNDPNAAGGDPTQQDPNAMGADPMGADPNAAGSDPMAADPNGQNQDPNAMQMNDPNAMGADPMGADPMAAGGIDAMPPMDDVMDDSEVEVEEEDEVIDVEDITKAQEKTSSRVNKVGRNLGKVDNKIEDIMNMIQSLTQMIDSNNEKIAEFQKEFEKRNPTPVEQMNLRSLDSFPFNENPKKYWEKKGTQPYVSGNRYEAYADNNEPVAKKEYVITNKDVEDFNTRKIEDSFHINDELRSTIEKIFDL